MDAQEYWNTTGVKKSFEDHLYTEKFEPFLTKEARILEYGCGYGRMLNLLSTKGYKNLVGYDFSTGMIERGHKMYPELELHPIKKSGVVPAANDSADLVILSTILTSVVEKNVQKGIIDEMRRLLRPSGFLYLSDFTICHDPYYTERYGRNGEDWGVYTNSEGLKVRHHTTQWISELLRDFDIQWMEQFSFKTMNNNPAQTIHCLVRCPA